MEERRRLVEQTGEQAVFVDMIGMDMELAGSVDALVNFVDQGVDAAVRFVLIEMLILDPDNAIPKQ
jgi:hypothetical protein